MSKLSYWEKRKEQNLLNAEKQELIYEKKLGNVYLQSSKNIENEINNLYAKYFTNNNISLDIVQRKLTTEEMVKFRNSLLEKIKYAENNNFDQSYIKSLKKMVNGTYRITRLEELQQNVGFELQKLKYKEYGNLTKLLTEQYKDGYYRTVFNTFQEMGVGGSFTLLNKKAIEKAINEKWAGDNYSGRIWKNKTSLEYTLMTEIPKNIVLGKGPDDLARTISNNLSVDFSKAQRLARTELNNIYNSATESSYKSSGVVRRYKYVATLDDRTSDICQELDGQVFDVNEAQVGVNYPPMHPNCRSTTVAVFDGEEYEERLAKGEKGYYKVPGNMNYETWFNKYVNKSGYMEDEQLTKAEVDKDKEKLKNLKEKI